MNTDVFMDSQKVAEHVYRVGGSDLSHELDCNVYTLDGTTELFLIDSGCGLGTKKIIENIEKLGFNTEQLSGVVNTHCHYRHAGGNAKLNQLLGYCEVITHELDAPAIEMGDPKLTGASYYGSKFEPSRVDVRIFAEDDGSMKWRFDVGDFEIRPIPTPGHTPGSMAVYGKIDNVNVLFAGDIDGSFRQEWNSDLESWKKSVRHLLELDLDLICAGHLVVKEKPKEWLRSLLL
jgi:glyoxylase-like metal-dependent hydrolase (beta-lactamase superfamily II)